MCQIYKFVETEISVYLVYLASVVLHCLKMSQVVHQGYLSMVQLELMKAFFQSPRDTWKSPKQQGRNGS